MSSSPTANRTPSTTSAPPTSPSSKRTSPSRSNTSKSTRPFRLPKPPNSNPFPGCPLASSPTTPRYLLAEPSTSSFSTPSTLPCRIRLTSATSFASTSRTQAPELVSLSSALPAASSFCRDSPQTPSFSKPRSTRRPPGPLSDTLSSFGNDPGLADVIANLQQFEAQEQSFQLQLRARYTLDALNQIARSLPGIPGRKNLIWFSGSFPINILPDGDLQNPFAIVASAEEEFRETTNLLTASQVAVYPIDARGLMTSPNLSAANSGSKYVRDPTRFSKDEAKFFQQTADEHSTMLQMAEETGGRAFINTNDLSQAVAES